MPYFKWKAYDIDGQPYDGVEESESIEWVALDINANDLEPSQIKEINYEEYTTLRRGYESLDRFRKKKRHHLPKRFDPASLVQPEKPDKSKKWMAAAIMLLLAIIAYLLIYP